MTIISLKEQDVARALAFVLPYERFCVTLAEKLRTRAAPAFAAVEADGGSSGALRGVFTFSDAGQVFHCLPQRDEDDRRALTAALRAFFAARADHKLFSVGGETHGTALMLAAIKSALHRHPARLQRYDFMRAGAPAGGARPQAVCKIVRCTPSMAELLAPLQRAYEKEEVVFNLATYNANVSLLALKKALQEKAVYAVFDADGALVAKGGTNAHGVHYVQLGGVYTEPAARGKGYASALIRHIVADFAAQQKQVALFVKPQNAAAQRLYAACGFAKYGEYETAYF